MYFVIPLIIILFVILYFIFFKENKYKKIFLYIVLGFLVYWLIGFVWMIKLEVKSGREYGQNAAKVLTSPWPYVRSGLISPLWPYFLYLGQTKLSNNSFVAPVSYTSTNLVHSSLLVDLNSNTTSQINYSNESFSTSKKPDDRLPFRSIGPGDYVGTFTVKGYVQIERNIPECGAMEECSVEELRTVPRYDYVSLIVTKSDNKLFQEILEKQLHSPPSIGLGCLVDNRKIKYINYEDADENGRMVPAEKQVIQGNDFKEIIRSSPSRQIKLQVTAPYFTGGFEPPWCYTKYRNFKVVGQNFIFPS